MASPISLPIAQLRDLGCKVNTLWGHDPKIGSFLYGITLPKGVGAPEFTDIDQDAEAGVRVQQVNRQALTYRKSVYRAGQPIADKQEIRAAEVTLARRLESAASYLKDRLEANRQAQAFIDTLPSRRHG